MTEDQIRQLCRDMRGETTNNRLPDNIARQLLESMEEIELGNGDNLFEPFSQNSDIYVLAQGILRLYYNAPDGKQRTFAFGMPGTFFPRINTLSFGGPSPLGCASCCKGTVVLHISASAFEKFLRRYPEAAWWWIELLQNQLGDLETSFVLKNGDARTRFRALAQDRPTILRECPMGVIASYLGITQSYLSTLRREWAHGE